MTPPPAALQEAAATKSSAGKRLLREMATPKRLRVLIMTEVLVGPGVMVNYNSEGRAHKVRKNLEIAIYIYLKTMS
jgi:hypothetical protein